MNAKRLLALLLALVMVLSMAACGSNNSVAEAPAEEPAEAPAEAPAEGPAEDEGEAATSGANTLVVGYDAFNEKFSPFFSTTQYDQDVWALTSIVLLPADRTGAILLNSKDGETVEYNGTDYTYYGAADCEIVENDDGSVDYNITMRDDLVFSDGVPVTIDDVIFSMYVYLDPTYDGSTTLLSQPIAGLSEYRSGVEILADLIFAAGEDNADFTYWTEEQQTAFWNEAVPAAGAAFAQEIVDYMGGTVSESAAGWGFDVAEDGTVEDFWNVMVEAYEGDLVTLSSVETAGSTLWSFLPAEYNAGISTGNSAPNVTGIVRTGDYSMTITTTSLDATFIYQLNMAISPLHYYGDESLYDYDNNMFGFEKGDLSIVKAKTTVPLGAGPYTFEGYSNNIVSFKANPLYFEGEPKIEYINYMYVNESDKINGIQTGTIDMSNPTYSRDNANAIANMNGNGDVDGPVITTHSIDNLGYGYLAMNAYVVNVGGEPGSEASKNFRKALGTVFAHYREMTVDSYYGETASVINYPISNTSWAAPRPSDDDYKVAFSTDVNGDPIYTAGMTDEESDAAALEAALGFFEAAGFTVENGQLTAAPEGAALEYEVMIPANGNGDHPSFMLLTEAKNALATIGFNLIVTDLSDSSLLWDAIDAHTIGMWTAAWAATADPDMYQIYYSDMVHNTGVNPEPGKNPYGGPDQGGSSYTYAIADEELDQLIMDARQSTDQVYRKALYKAALDIIVDWACEIPVYQRQNCWIFSTERINIDTITPDITPFYDWTQEIVNMELN